jgi:Choline/ethanolamine kinase
MVYFYHLAEWQQQTSVEEEFVFCHGDLSQNNILVNPKTLQIVAIIDWEYGGFFPQDHEIPFYESSETSGEQVKGSKLKPIVGKIIEFWRQSRTCAG